MNISRIVILSFLLSAPVAARNNAQQSAPANPAGQQNDVAQGSDASPDSQTKVDAAKETDIRHLLELTGGKAAMMQVLGGSGDTIRPIITNALPPGEYRQKLVDLFIDKFENRVNEEADSLMKAAVSAYDKYFSADDIKGLIRFYETPLGQKAGSVLPKLSLEMQAQGRQIGEKLGRECMLQVLAEHPDLEQSLEDAQKAVHPQ